ncbi:PREDICTED: boophilin-G2-like [Thamnophis sirtalis]|uniref:Boophilin-G2-like n=1 Tax=Thamnophis sirtalis TaxID=35019 RepID=A0A6I9XA62_9SAUR|nr:PREDICTED: boophilin-G2-like [Thamnophis sirtalis]
MSYCLHDGNCPGADKCCSFGCTLRCMKPVTGYCQEPPEEGPCNKKTYRWFYDPKTGECKKFIFGGCGGNRNNFINKWTCQVVCRHKAEIDCSSVPKYIPSCRVPREAFFYNITTKSCQYYTDFGCGTNRNSYESLTGCQEFCEEAGWWTVIVLSW